MEMELRCPHCGARIPVVLTECVAEVPGDDRLAALGDGQTFEDLLYTSLTKEGPLICPKCERSVRVSQETLNRLAMELLAFC